MTLRDVAERAGVAIGTVRRALNNHPTVRPYILERVRRAARELDYQPNLLAGALKKKALGVVPISVVDLDNIHYGSLAAQLSRCLVDAGMEPALCFSPERLLRMQRTLSTSASIIVEGFDPAIIRELTRQQKVVTVEAQLKPMPNVGNVEVDFLAVYRRAVNALLATGRRRVALCSEFYYRAVKHGWREEKFSTVLAALRAARTAPVGPRGHPVFDCTEALAAWLDERPGSVDAVFCQDDMHAVRVVGAMAARGLRTPDDILVIGCDNKLVLEGMWSVDVETAVLAQEAVGLLLRLLNGESRVDPRVYLPKLVDHRGVEVAVRGDAL